MILSIMPYILSNFVFTHLFLHYYTSLLSYLCAHSHIWVRCAYKVLKQIAAKFMRQGQDMTTGCLHKILSYLTDIKKVIAIDLHEHGVHFQNPRKECVGLEDRNMCRSFSSRSTKMMIIHLCPQNYPQISNFIVDFPS